DALPVTVLYLSLAVRSRARPGGAFADAHAQGLWMKARRPLLVATNERTGALLGERVAVARTPLTRMRGLIARPPLAAGDGLLIEPCSGVHMWFMRYAIDV